MHFKTKRRKMEFQYEEDDSLSSLYWLMNFSPPTDPQGSPPAGDTADPGAPLDSPVPSGCGLPAYTSPGKTIAPLTAEVKSRVCPPHTYAALIKMAIQASPDRTTTVRHIYEWITDNFHYYRNASPGWKNMIRQNLSLSKRFIKVKKGDGEEGKQGFWTIDPSPPRQRTPKQKRSPQPPQTFNALKTRNPAPTLIPPEPLQTLIPPEPLLNLIPLEPLQTLIPPDPLQPPIPPEPLQTLIPLEPLQTLIPPEPLQPLIPLEPLQTPIPPEPFIPLEPLQTLIPLEPLQNLIPPEPLQNPLF